MFSDVNSLLGYNEIESRTDFFHFITCKSTLQNISLGPVRKSHSLLTNSFHKIITYSFTCWI